MPSLRPFANYDDRLIDLLDRALRKPVALRRRFDDWHAATAFRQQLYNVRRAARQEGKRPEWERLSVLVQENTHKWDIIIGVPSNWLDEVLEDVELENE